jgi:hypothetical protein
VLQGARFHTRAECRQRVITSNALTEQMFSGFTPKAYMPTPTARRVEVGQGIVIQPPTWRLGIVRSELSDDEWATIRCCRTRLAACRVWMIGVS